MVFGTTSGSGCIGLETKVFYVSGQSPLTLWIFGTVVVLVWRPTVFTFRGKALSRYGSLVLWI